METIPETPQPIQEPQKIIEKVTLPKKEKNPGRVAAGKRLAEWNRKKKLEKLEKKSVHTVHTVDTVDMVDDPPTTYDKCYLFLGIVGVTLTALGLYYTSTRSMHVCPPTRQSTNPATVAKVTDDKPNAVYKME